MDTFLSCDWGTTSFRLRRVDSSDGTILDEHQEPSGVRALHATCPADNPVAREKIFAEFLRAQIHSLAGDATDSAQPLPVFVSGMASSSIGWKELPYASLPIGLDGSGVNQLIFDLALDERAVARIHLISGLRGENEIMRGEETEIFGLFADQRHAGIARNGIVVLPGTHSKHARLRDGLLTEFHTFMTGELFDVLSTHSVLRVSVEGSLTLGEPRARAAFIDGVRAAAAAGMDGALFQTRTRSVLHGVPPPINRWFLSGVLIGSEMGHLSRGEENPPILLAAPETISPAYQLALETLERKDVTTIPPDEMAGASVRGHRLLLRRELPK